MPLCPQITNTPITVVLNSNFTVTDVIPVLPANTEQVNEALADAAAALAEANDAYSAAIGSLQPSANTIVNASNQITAINGGGITVYSGASPSTGARVVLNSAGLAGFNSSSTGPSNGATFSISASTGAAVFSGDVTGSTITGGTLNINGNAIIDATGKLTATGADINGKITSISGSIGGWTIGSTSISRTVNFRTTTLNASDGTISIEFNGAANLTGGSITLGTPGAALSFGAAGMLFDNRGASAYAAIDGLNELGGFASILRIYAPIDKGIRIVPNAGLGGLTHFASVEGSLQVLFATVLQGIFRLPGIGSTTSAANLNWGTGGSGDVKYVTSSTRKVKDNITDIRNVAELNPKALLDLPVRAFTYIDGYLSEEDDRSEVLVPGFIAEEMDAIYPIAADYDENGPSNWNDRFVVPAMLSLIQDLYKEIEILKGE